MQDLAFVTDLPDLAPREDAEVEWWFLQGRVDRPRPLYLMAAFFLVRGLGAVGPTGAMLLRHVLDPARGTVWTDSRLTPPIAAHHDKVAETLAAGFAQPMRGLALWRHRQDMAAWADRAGLVTDAAAPSLQASPFAVHWDGFRLEVAGQDLRLHFAAAPRHEALDLVLTPQTPWLNETSARLHPSFGDNFAYQCCPQVIARTPTGAEAGQFWIDRQWGRYDEWLMTRKAPQRGALGWDWFGLTLDDGRALLVNRHRLCRTGTAGPTFAVLFDGGPPQRLTQVRAAPLRHWVSPRSGARYPVAWRLALPEIGLEAQVAPLASDQEIPVYGTTAIWEGAARVTGRQNGRALSGQGRVELVGYATAHSVGERLMQSLRRATHTGIGASLNAPAAPPPAGVASP